jgi:glycosyltransferase involved in cell wall biosynthesis
MRGKAKYSVILPVRNGGEYVKECVNSILSQTYPDVDLHVLDNCSNDGTLEWIQSLNDERVKLYPAENPLSMEENWARVLSVPKNEFMTIIGHDDTLDNNYLVIINELIQRHPRASLYQTHFRFIDSQGKDIRKCRPMPEVQSAPEFIQSLLRDSFDTMGTGYMMRAKDYDGLGGIQPYPDLLFADHELWIKLTAIGYKATSASEGFLYRLHESTSRKAIATNYIRAFFRFMNFLKGMGISNDNIHAEIEMYGTEYIRYYCKSLSHRLLRTSESRREGMTVSSFIEQCKKIADDLVPGNHFYPNAQFNIRLAKQIDSNRLLRRLYLLFKKIYKRPIYS